MNLECRATNGERCANERHLFRVGVDATAATEFRATREEFADALQDALIDHAQAGRPGTDALYLQVATPLPGGRFDWRNITNPSTGGIMAVTPKIAGQHETIDTLFLWACNSVQMGRDIAVIASGLSGEVE